jgi:NADH-quinone oxidoreductase subunit L
MLLIITCVSFFVHLYSANYMKEDPHILRFMAFLSLFTFFMIFLVTADNFLQLFFGWEGVGLCSYLLINFWFTKISANKAGIKALIINRIADIFFLLGILLLLLKFKTLDFALIFQLFSFVVGNKIEILNFNFDLLTLICFFIFIGAVGKSAQFGLHTWLPDAMEGPTPVSSLLHAATMVTAGIFLVLRCSPIFEYCDNVLILVSVIGGVNAIFFSLVSVFQYDIKKIIAYSTCSQLGYMFFSCGLSFYNVAFFHLFNHAFFKSLLFLGAGSIIHSLADEQDIRKMGGLLNFLPFTYICMVIGSLSLIGFPFFTGFYSKDLILELTYSRYLINSLFLYSIGVLAAFFTCTYSVRLLIFVFFFENRGFRALSLIYENPFLMSVSLFCLSLLTICTGYIFSEIFLGWGNLIWDNALFIMPKNVIFLDSEFLPVWAKLLPFFSSLLGFLVSYFSVYFFKHINLKKLFYISNLIAYFFYSAGFFNLIYDSFFFCIFKSSNNYFTKILDKGVFEYLGPQFLFEKFRYYSFMWKWYLPSFVLYSIFYFFVFLSIVMFIFHWYFYLIKYLLFKFSLFVIFVLIFFFEADNKYE